MIKYIGSKRALLERIVGLTRALSPQGGRVCDLFSGGARVGHALKAAGFAVHANDHNAYAHTLGVALVQADGAHWADRAERLIAELNAVAPEPGWFTRTYCEEARFFHPDNGARIDAVLIHARASSSDTMQYSKTPRPSPPCSAGTVMPK